MSYTKQDVTDLHAALAATRTAQDRTKLAVKATGMDLDFETAATAEAVGALAEAWGLLDRACDLLAAEYTRIAGRAQEETV